MMYKEAAQFIESNRNTVIEIEKDKEPASDIFFMVAPGNIYVDEQMRQVFLDRCIEGSEVNEYTLSSNWPHLYLSNNLAAWVIFKSKGNFIWLELKSYLEGQKIKV